MIKRSLFGVFLFALGVFGQTCTVTAPATFAGYQGQQYSLSYSGLTAAPYITQYVTDAYGDYDPGLGAGSERGYSLGPTTGPTAFVRPINSSWHANGPRLVTATVYDVFRNVLATCTATGTTANAYPISTTPTLTVATSPAISAPVSGALTVTPTIGGVGADTIACYYYVDGLSTTQQNAATSCTTAVGEIHSERWVNSPHVVCLYVYDSTGGLTHGAGNYEGQAAEWCRTVTFSNGTIPMAVALNSDKIYLAPGGPAGGNCLGASPSGSGSCTLTANTLNTDGTITAGSPVGSPMYFAKNTAIATINQSTGVVTGVANGSTYVYSFVPTVSGTDLAVNNSGFATSVSNPFNVGEGPLNGGAITQWGCYVSAGAGFTTGFYLVSGVSFIGGSPAFGASLSPWTGGGLAHNLSGGTYQCGPVAQSWIFVWPTNILPHIGSDAQVHLTYDPVNSAVLHDMFTGSNALNADQPYYYQGHLNGAAYEFNNIGKWWAFEFGAGCLGAVCAITDVAPTSGTYVGWQANLASSISSQVANLLGLPNLYMYLHWDNLTNANTNMYGATLGPGASLSPPAFQNMISQYTATGKVLGSYWHDENPMGCPGCGPIVYDPAGTGAGNSWLISITATGGGGAGEVCTAAIGPNTYTIYGTFVVHGSAIPNMNTVYNSPYTAVASGGTFHFTCPNVADGTYNNSNDPGFTLEPLSNGYTNSSGAYVPYNAYQLLHAQINAVPGHFGVSGRSVGLAIGAIYTAATGVCAANSVNNNFRSYGGWSPYGSVQAGDYTDLYAQAGGTSYIVSRAPLNANLTDPGWLGQTIRILYGCGYSPSLPLNALTQGEINYYGVKGVPVALTSCVGNLCTFSAPHGIANVTSGLTRMYVTGATDVSSPQDSTNNNLVIVDCPTSTTCHVDLAATDQTQNANFGSGLAANTGTITTQDGTQVTMAGNGSQAGGMSATGVLNSYASFHLVDEMRPLATAGACTGAGSATCLLRKRGQTFTFSGTATGVGAAYFNANIFRIAPEYLNVATAPNVNVMYRQLPVLSSTGGMAFIIQNDSYVKGLSASRGPENPGAGSGDINPEWMFTNIFGCMLLRCSGELIYQMGSYVNGYSDQLGFTIPGNAVVQWGPRLFASNSVFQIPINQHFENGPTLPGWKAHEFAAQYWNGNIKYWQQPRINAPSIGKSGEIECGGATGSYGSILACVNDTDGPRTITIPSATITPLLQSGQNWIWHTVDAFGIGAMNIATAGTSTLSVSLDPGQAVSLKFPVNFASEMQQPSISVCLSDIAGATKVAVYASYDPYYLDVSPVISQLTTSGSNSGCASTLSGTPPVDLNIGNPGSHPYRLVYTDNINNIKARSDVQYQ